MALKLLTEAVRYRREDLAVPSYGAMALKPELRWRRHRYRILLQSPPTGRWP